MVITYAFIDDPSPREVAQLTDLYRLAGWWTDSADNPATVSGIVRGSHCFLTARNNGARNIIAMGRAISDRASDAYIQDVTVDPTYRRQGIGTQVISRLVSRLEADGIGWIGLIAERKTHPFYQLLGFSPMADSVPMLKT